jgi:hypothetical protein
MKLKFHLSVILTRDIPHIIHFPGMINAEGQLTTFYGLLNQEVKSD